MKHSTNEPTTEQPGLAPVSNRRRRSRAATPQKPTPRSRHRAKSRSSHGSSPTSPSQFPAASAIVTRAVHNRGAPPHPSARLLARRAPPPDKHLMNSHHGHIRRVRCVTTEAGQQTNNMKQKRNSTGCGACATRRLRQRETAGRVEGCRFGGSPNGKRGQGCSPARVDANNGETKSGRTHARLPARFSRTVALFIAVCVIVVKAVAQTDVGEIAPRTGAARHGGGAEPSPERAQRGPEEAGEHRGSGRPLAESVTDVSREPDARNRLEAPASRSGRGQHRGQGERGHRG